MFADRLSDNGEDMPLRFVDAFTLYEGFPAGRTDVQCAVAKSNAIGATCKQGLFVACSAVIHAELQRRRAPG